MIVPVSICDLLMCLIEEANEGINGALEDSKNKPFFFVAPQIDLRVQCTVFYGPPLCISPSNALKSNCYSIKDNCTVNVQIKLKPK